jgi:hypothetical protein
LIFLRELPHRIDDIYGTGLSVISKCRSVTSGGFHHFHLAAICPSATPTVDEFKEEVI